MNEDDQVGSVGEEAAKLFGALADAFREVDQHVAADDPECTWCPVCRAVHLVRETSPEVKAHLASAASSLVQAAAGLLATHVPPERRDRAAGVERIDLGEDVPDDGWAEDE
ncbi:MULTISPECIES: hypothetical protein [unclassified Nocardioides]|uniref:hypothetical protein n=1 Tax=unclassified Nocardioides TaxID=2615069 RepID=UPI003014D48D